MTLADLSKLVSHRSPIAVYDANDVVIGIVYRSSNAEILDNPAEIRRISSSEGNIVVHLAE